MSNLSFGKVAERYYGMEIWFTPKYHCELAGEGIEYLWGFTLQLIRSQGSHLLCDNMIFSIEMIGIERVSRFSCHTRPEDIYDAYFVMHGHDFRLK